MDIDDPEVLQAAADGRHVHCPYCCGPEADYHTMCFYEVADECTDIE